MVGALATTVGINRNWQINPERVRRLANPFRVKTLFDVMVPKVLASSNLGLKLANAFGVDSTPKSANAFGVNSTPKFVNAFGVNQAASLLEIPNEGSFIICFVDRLRRDRVCGAYDSCAFRRLLDV